MINRERLWQNIITLGEVGRSPDAGVTRLPFTPEDLKAKELIKGLMESAGLSVHEDAIGNINGRREGIDPNAPALIIGSHLDTVFNGGIFDGSLGILAGIEVVQTLHEKGIITKHPIEVYAFRDEEGCRFNFSLLGSRGVVGGLKRADLEYKDSDGVTIYQAMKDCGIHPEDITKAARKPEEIKAYLEMHVEQGKVLECADISVGVVTGIASSLRLIMTVTGKADHAGATPMQMRYDALAAAAQIICVVEKEARKTQSAVGTVGQIHAYPGGINIIPGKVEFTIDLRDVSSETGLNLEENILAQAKEICSQRGLDLKIEILQREPSSPCADDIQEMIMASCEELRIQTMKLPSGAGHDAMQMINLCPIGMIFIRSKKGISHHPDEYSTPDDCALGANVLYQTVLKIAEKI